MAACPGFPKDPPDIEFIENPDWVVISCCWRNYIATWEIKDNRLYLRDIEGVYKLTSTKPILASWFTGNIKLNQGKLLHYVHAGFGSIYEQELHIEIKNGAVVSEEMINNVGSERVKKFEEEKARREKLTLDEIDTPIFLRNKCTD